MPDRVIGDRLDGGKPMQEVTEQVRTMATRVAGSYGLEVFDVQYRREGSAMVLRVRIDRPGTGRTAEESVSVEDCANVSRDLSALLDVEDIVPAAYTLEVSSPGLDRPLRRADDYVRFTGRRAKVVLRSAIDGQMFFKGRLDGVEDTDRGAVVIIVGDDGVSHRAPFDVITRGNLEVEF